MSDSKPPQHTKPARHFISGLSSGVASAVILQPLDLLKTRVQQSGRPSLAAQWRELSGRGTQSKGSSKFALQRLWRGTVPSVLRTGFGSALYFTTLNGIRVRMQQAQNSGRIPSGGPNATGSSSNGSGSSSALPALSPTANLLSGAIARTFAGFILMPLTVLKVRFESSLYSYNSMFAAAADIQRTEGLRGFFSGFGATAARDAPYAGMYVVFYEVFKRKMSALAASPGGDSGHAMASSTASSINFTAGLFSGALCSAISNPFDAVKTRIQLQPARYRNMLSATSVMLREDGVRSFWSGLGLRMSRKALSSALAWTLYEELIRRSARVERV